MQILRELLTDMKKVKVRETQMKKRKKSEMTKVRETKKNKVIETDMAGD
jgi:hypothetical protein